MKDQTGATSTGLSDVLIQAGVRGIHPLFDARAIRRAFSRIHAGLVNGEELLLAHQALRELADLHDLVRMRAYVDQLPENTVDMLVYLYFRRIDQAMELAGHTLH